MSNRLYLIAIGIVCLTTGSAWAVILQLSSVDPSTTPTQPNPSRLTQEVEFEFQIDAPDFQRHVIPLIGRLGCNARECHGSFQGRGGMSLSLFGYDFANDHSELTGQSLSESGSRINLGQPDASLILRKATAQVDHEGGQRVERDSWQYDLLRRWIANGAPGKHQASTLVSLEVVPPRIDCETSDSAIALNVRATWSDGTREDVTRLATFRTNDDAIVSVTEQGMAQGRDSGDTHVIVLYDNAIVAVPAVVRNQSVPTVEWPDDPIPTKIDELVNDNLRRLGLVPSEVCGDAEFLRRASIDLTGTLPSPQEVEAFLADSNVNKRQRKIDELVQRPAFAAWWATKLCDFTGCNPDQQAELGQELAEQWYMWIYQRLLENTPYDQIVEGILLAGGRDQDVTFAEYSASVSAYFRDESPASFSERDDMPHYWSRRSLEQPEDKGIAVAHSFMGVRLQCAQCHKHPWDQWTQDDFQQFSEFFKPIRFGVAPNDRDSYRELASQIGLRLRGDDGEPIRDAQLVRAKAGETIPWRSVYLEPDRPSVTLGLLRSGDVTIPADGDPRLAIMEWLREPDNPWFARAIVNRVWASCFYVGIVHPPDDLTAANPPSNPELLDWLSNEFIRQGYDLRWLVKEITRSATWQRSCIPNETNRLDDRHFSRAIPRRLPAEVVYDAIKQAVCGSTEHQTVRDDLSRRAVGHLSMRMAGTHAMQVLGKPQRSAACDCERVSHPSLMQAVFMQNDPLVYLLLEDSGWLREIGEYDEADEATLAEWIEEAWLRVLARMPRNEEIARALEHLRAAEIPANGMEDLLWSLLNTREFLLNH